MDRKNDKEEYSIDIATLCFNKFGRRVVTGVMSRFGLDDAYGRE